MGPWVFVGGQAPLGPKGEVLYQQDPEQQAVCTLNYLSSVLQSAGASIGDVVTGVTYCTSELVPDVSPKHTIRMVDELAYADQQIEMDAIAWVGAN